MKILSLSLADPNSPAIGSTYVAAFAPFAIAAHPGGRFLYTTAPAEALAYAFSYSAGGVLTPIGGGFAAPQNARAVVMSIDGSRLYIASYDTGRVQCYAIGNDGFPIPKGDPVVSGVRPVGMTFDPDGKFLYVVNRGEVSGASSITGYAAGGDCGLTPVSEASVPAGTVATAIISVRFTP
jgi:DNA-binding beta-propeller fold protein YncE